MEEEGDVTTYRISVECIEKPKGKSADKAKVEKGKKK